MYSITGLYAMTEAIFVPPQVSLGTRFPRALTEAIFVLLQVPPQGLRLPRAMTEATFVLLQEVYVRLHCRVNGLTSNGPTGRLSEGRRRGRR